MSKKVIARNILATLILQFVTIINGLVVPKIFISFFGSEANGLVTSINQFLNYVTLLEGGLNGVIMASLYKPLRDNDHQKISAIFNATQRFFKQIGVIYIAYSLVLAVVYPLFVETAYSYPYVLTLVLVLAVNLFVQYFFSMTYQVLIRASQNVYLGALTKAGVMLLNIVLVIILTKLYPDLILVKTVSAIVLFIQPIVYCAYTKKHFQIDKSVPRDDNAIKQRWAGFGHTLAYFINTNISVLMLTAFSSLSTVSVYSVYLMITNSIRNFSVSIASAIVPSLGSVIASGDREESNKAFNVFEFGMGFFTTLLFTCGIALVVPFVRVYTANITDAEYIQPLFAIVLMVAELIYCIREPYINAAYAAGHIKQTVKFAYAETAIHIVLSFLLVHKLNLVGVALAFLVSLLFRMVAHVVYLKKHIFQRSIRRSVRTIALFMAVSALVVFVANLILPLTSIGSYFEWFLNGVAVFAMTLVALMLLSVVAFRSELKAIISKKAKSNKLQAEEPENETKE